jgi:hypothetical protein
MIALPAGVQVYLAAGATDMRKGFDGLAALVQTQLAEDPFSGQLFVFRSRAAVGSRYCGGREMGFVCSRSAWSEAALSGHKQPTAQ